MSTVEELSKSLRAMGRRFPEHIFSMKHSSGGIILRTPEHSIPTSKGYAVRSDYLFYPRTNHIEKFLKSSSTLAGGGPGSDYPGVVGMVYTSKIIPDRGKNASFLVVQSAYNVGEYVNRSLATKYGGWRVHLIRLALENAERNGAKKIVLIRRSGQTRTEGKKLGRSLFTEEIFRKEALKLGFTVRKVLKGLVAKK